jgi:dTDP-4-dehydrorhamnose 3,5-epimerase
MGSFYNCFNDNSNISVNRNINRIFKKNIMKFDKIPEIDGCFLITFKKFYDERGYFSVPFNRDEFNEGVGMEVNFIQDNLSYSSKNVIRGLHFQTGDYEQSKLVTCTYGHVLDVVVDIRKDSPTYGKHISVDLGECFNRLLFVPKGCAHGFSVMSDYALFQYKVDNVYNKESEGGIIFNDKTLNIDWYISDIDAIVSEKDRELPTFLSL